MIYIGGLIAIHFIALTVYLLAKRYNPSVTLLVMGGFMFFTANLLGFSEPVIQESNKGFLLFDFFRLIIETFTERFGSSGLLIMLIGGYVQYMKKIKANDALIYVAMQPLSILRQYPYMAAVMIIPIGQVLFIATPSAVGLGLLLITTIYPVLIGLGVSRLAAVSVIAACTVFDMGPTSSNTYLASTILETDTITYFSSQLRVALPLTIVMMGLLLISNRYFDKKDNIESGSSGKSLDIDELIKTTPLYYAIFPTLPLLFTIIFSKSVNLLNIGIFVDIAPLILLSLVIAATAELFRRKSLKDLFETVTPFWIGAGRTFTSVIVLIVCAEIFAQGLMNLGLIDSIIAALQPLGLNSIFVTILITLLSFAAALITGSGVASFTTISSFVPELALKFGIPIFTIMVPIQLAAGLGRAASPIAIVIIAISEIAGVSPFDVAKRNIFPLLTISLLIVGLSYLLL